MSSIKDRGAYVRHDRVRLKIRRIEANRYRVSDLKGGGIEYRKRHDLPDAIAKAIDSAQAAHLYVDGWLNRAGRWSLDSGSARETPGEFVQGSYEQ